MDGSQSCVDQSNPQEPVNLQVIMDSIHSMIFSRLAQGSGYVTSWGIGDINFQVFPSLGPPREVYRVLPNFQL